MPLIFTSSRSNPRPINSPWITEALYQINIPSFKNYRSCRTAQFDYYLDKYGKIWIKSHNQQQPFTIKGGRRVACTPGWHLFEQSGIPKGSRTGLYKKTLLETDEQIIAIQVASEIIIAVSNKRNIFIYKPIDKFLYPTQEIVWKKYIGQPFRANIKIPENHRCFTFGVSIGLKLKKRVLEIMGPTDITKTSTDGAGIEHDSGQCSTLFTVSACGRIIYYWDTGLSPGSFQRALLSPLDGQAQIQGISTAGSTIFVSIVDNTGKLRYFKKHFDYENDGQAPGFYYSYDLTKADRTQQHQSLGHGTRIIPCDVWTEIIHPYNIPEYEHLLTSKVDIELTGHGEDARMIKIFGYNNFNQPGYYYKDIDQYDIREQNGWFFQTIELEQDKTLPIRIPYPYKTIAKLQKTYDSYVFVNYGHIKRYIKLQLKDFHPFNTAENTSKLILTDTTTGESATIDIKSVDGWNFHYLKPGQEELIASSDGIPKFCTATIRVPEDSYLGKNTLLSNIITQCFLPYNDKTRSLNIIATNQKLKLETTDKKILMQFGRVIPQEEYESSFYLGQALEILSASPENIQDCNLLIYQCTNLIKYLEKIHNNIRTRNFGFYLCYNLAKVARSIVSPVSTVIFDAHKITHRIARFFGLDEHSLPYAYMGTKALSDLKSVFKYNSQICKEVALHENKNFILAVNLLKEKREELLIIRDRLSVSLAWRCN